MPDNLAMELKPLITLLAIVNPLAIVPFFIHYTQGFSDAQRRRTVLIASFSAFAVIAACALLGRGLGDGGHQQRLNAHAGVVDLFLLVSMGGFG